MANNKPYYKRNFRGPNFGNDTNPLMASNLGGGLPPGLLPHSADQSVFQTNASHVLSSPNGTFNMMADATTAPYFAADGSMMQRSPGGKFSFIYFRFFLLNLTFCDTFLDMMELQR